mmetsp:Transcript_17220/g.57044  ORF Transcript_17220/g.57044 Transcript_17220/m.57044 type:complete len:217 (-) Transcript_17220:3027-3677(-)
MVAHALPAIRELKERDKSQGQVEGEHDGGDDAKIVCSTWTSNDRDTEGGDNGYPSRDQVSQPQGQAHLNEPLHHELPCIRAGDGGALARRQERHCPEHACLLPNGSLEKLSGSFKADGKALVEVAGLFTFGRVDLADLLHRRAPVRRKARSCHQQDAPVDQEADTERERGLYGGVDASKPDGGLLALGLPRQDEGGLQEEVVRHRDCPKEANSDHL